MSKKNKNKVNTGNKPASTATQEKQVVDKKVDEKPADKTVPAIEPEVVKDKLPAPLAVGQTTIEELRKKMSGSKLSTGATVNLAYVLQKRYMEHDSGAPKDPALIEMADSMLDPLTLLACLKFQADASNDVEIKLLGDPKVISSLQDAAAKFGIKLPTPQRALLPDGKTEKDGQMTLDLSKTKIPDKVANAIEEDIKKDHKADEDTKAGIETVDVSKVPEDKLMDSLNAILHKSANKYMNAATLLDAIQFLKAWDIFHKPDDKAKFEGMSIGDWIHELIKICGNTFLVKGLSTIVSNNIKASKNEIAAFCIVKKSLGKSAPSDESIADLMAALCEIHAREKAIEKLSFDKDGKKVDTLPTEPEITHLMSTMTEIKYLQNPIIDLDKIRSDYNKPTENDENGKRVFDSEIAENKKLLSLVIESYLPGMVKSLKANTLDDKDFDQIFNRIQGINNLFLPIDQQEEVKDDDGTIKRFFKKVFKVS